MYIRRSHLPPIGVGLRHPHFDAALAAPGGVDFVEVHAENFFAAGGATRQALRDIAGTWPVSLHATGGGLGSAVEVPQSHSGRLAALVERCEPVLVSEHAAQCWFELDGSIHHAGDLLPVAFDHVGRQRLATGVARLQDALRRPLLIENISAYVQFHGATLTEAAMLAAVCRETGCRLLLDIHNLMVNARNLGAADPLAYAIAWMDAFPADRVGEIHLAGSTPCATDELLIDDHANAPSDTLWQAYRHALRRFGAVPTLIEWDTNLPTWKTLVAQVDKARDISREVFDVSAVFG